MDIDDWRARRVMLDWFAGQGLNSVACSAFVTKWSLHQHARGDILFTQGREPRVLYFLCSGRVILTRTGGRRAVSRVVLAPAMLGERSLIVDEPYVETAEIIKDARIARIGAERFRALWLERPEIPRLIARILAVRIGEAEARAADLSFRTVRERLAAYLSRQVAHRCRRSTVLELDLSRRRLAEGLWTSPEVLSRAFSALTEEGIVSAQRRSVRISDIGRLRHAARIPSGNVVKT